MGLHSRRSWIKNNIGLAAFAVADSVLLVRNHISKPGKLQLAMHLGLHNTERLKICKQLG